jgi:hypothetical protein
VLHRKKRGRSIFIQEHSQTADPGPPQSNLLLHRRSRSNLIFTIPKSAQGTATSLRDRSELSGDRDHSVCNVQNCTIPVGKLRRTRHWSERAHAPESKPQHHPRRNQKRLSGWDMLEASACSTWATQGNGAVVLRHHKPIFRC